MRDTLIKVFVIIYVFTFAIVATIHFSDKINEKRSQCLDEIWDTIQFYVIDMEDFMKNTDESNGFVHYYFWQNLEAYRTKPISSIPGFNDVYKRKNNNPVHTFIKLEEIINNAKYHCRKVNEILIYEHILCVILYLSGCIAVSILLSKHERLSNVTENK